MSLENVHLVYHHVEGHEAIPANLSTVGVGLSVEAISVLAQSEVETSGLSKVV
jgi:hypothetical protein